MIASGEHMRPQFEELFTDCGRDSKAAGCVLDVDYEQFCLVGLDKVMHMLAHNSPPRTAEYIADEENLHWLG